MKKFSLLFAAIFCAGFLSAQTSKGNLFLGGNGSFTRSIEKFYSGGSLSFEDVQIEINFQPMVGFFLADGIVVGGALDIFNQKSYPKGSPDLSSSFGYLQVGPFARYYHHTDYFGEAMITFGNTGSEGFKTSRSTWSVGIGRAFFFNEFVAIEPVIFYRTQTTDPGDNRTVDSGFGAKLGFAIFIE